ncbi:hypothetical protein [Paenibacillus pini]|uniref:Uncharacterized protein n=1 Tax=Paenibacillus pini JCM 16418 TaxID=1236976 RepID=W7Y770_9BACL|nr:hypothetical protein [Paenibacillus pini]GAF06790.1 hypothetical protein JCM16418_772 [Paenibacillus pini JCM 16418]
MSTGVPMMTVQMDFLKLQEAINAAVDQALERHSVKSNLPPLLTKTQLQDLLGIKATKAAELLSREDFPVTREFGHPRVPTHLLMIWIDEHTDWVRENAKDLLKGKRGVA